MAHEKNNKKLERNLRYYQCITTMTINDHNHPDYNITQLVYLKVDCPIDGDLDELVAFGARSFSIWNGNTGKIVYDSKNDENKGRLTGKSR